jgi:hypothetical protein
MADVAGIYRITKGKPYLGDRKPSAAKPWAVTERVWEGNETIACHIHRFYDEESAQAFSEEK